MEKLSSSRQRNAVSEGFALGLLMNDQNTIDFKDIHITSVELAFAGAWRDWPYKRQFPQVNTDLKNGLNEHIVITRVDRRKHTLLFYWDDLTVHARNDWALEDHPETLAGYISVVPAEGWKQLAGAVLKRLRERNPTSF